MGEADYNVLSLDNNFNKEEYEKLIDSKKGIYFVDYRWQLLKKRQNENIDFANTKENVEKLFLESFSDKEYIRVLKDLKSNGWSLEQAYNRVINTGRSLKNVSRSRKFN